MVQNTDRVVVQEGGGEIAQDGGGEGEGDDDEWVAEHRAVAEKEGRKFVNLPYVLPPFTVAFSSLHQTCYKLSMCA